MENDIKKVLITGATGFLGKSVCQKLIKKNIEIIKCSRENNNNYEKIDLLNFTATSEIIKKHSPELIIHCAANTPKNSNQIVYRYLQIDTQIVTHY